MAVSILKQVMEEKLDITNVEVRVPRGSQLVLLAADGLLLRRSRASKCRLRKPRSHRRTHATMCQGGRISRNSPVIIRRSSKPSLRE